MSMTKGISLVSEATQQVKQPQVQNWLARLNEELNVLHDTIGDLSQKLSPVLAVSVSKETIDEKMPTLVPLAEIICMRTYTVSEATKKLRAIIESLEL